MSGFWLSLYFRWGFQDRVLKTKKNKHWLSWVLISWSFWCTPLKISIEPENDGLVLMIFLFQEWLFSGSMLLFRVVNFLCWGAQKHFQNYFKHPEKTEYPTEFHWCCVDRNDAQEPDERRKFPNVTCSACLILQGFGGVAPGAKHDFGMFGNLNIGSISYTIHGTGIFTYIFWLIFLMVNS